MIIHQDALRAASALVCDEDKTTGFGIDHIAVFANGTVEATDGKTLIRIEGAAGDAKDFPVVNGVDVGAVSDKPMLVLPSTLKGVFGLLKANKRGINSIPILGNVVISPGADKLTIAATDLDQRMVTMQDVTDRRWPRTDSILAPKERTDKATVTLDIDLLIDTLKAVKATGAINVKLRVADERDLVFFESAGDPLHRYRTEAFKVSGAIMPVAL